MEEGNVEDGKWYKDINVIFNSWMPQGIDWSGCFKYIKPKPQIIAYVKSRSTGIQPGMAGNFNNWDSYAPHPDFIEIDRWRCYGHDDFADDKTPVIASKTGEVIIHAKKDFWNLRYKAIEALKMQKTIATPYNWEKELPKE